MGLCSLKSREVRKSGSCVCKADGCGGYINKNVSQTVVCDTGYICIKVCAGYRLGAVLLASSGL